MAAVFTLLVVRVFPGLLDGLLVDTDSYMRLVRVRQLVQSGEWFDGGMIGRSNAPLGSSLHWTRPVDVLILLVAAPLTPFLGFDRALHLAGVLFSPAVLVAVCFATAWSVRPLAGPGMRYYTMIAVLAQAGIMGYALPGRADHHVLILLAFVAMNGAALRLLLGGSSRWGWIAGAWAALGLWISTEFLIALAAVLLALALAWVLKGRLVVEGARSFTLGLLAVTALGVLVEGSGSPLVAEYDRISIVHVVLAALTAAFWALPASRTAAGWNGRKRSAYAAAGALAAGALLLAVYPRFFGGPMVDVDPELKRSWLPLLTEYRPYLVPDGLSDVGRIVAYLGHALLAAGMAVYAIGRFGRSDGAAGEGIPRRQSLVSGWILLGVGLAAFLPLGIRWVRFVPYAEILGVLGSMVLLAGTLEVVGRRLSGLRRSAARVIMTAGVLAGPLLVGASVMALGGEAGEGARAAGATQAAACPAEALVAALNDPARLGERSRIVLAHVDLGPMLLYRTPHSVVATPYHRNAAGILDTRRIMQSEDPEAARRMMAERGVDVVIPCGFLAPPATPSPSRSPTFATLLQRGREPDWLIRHSLADGAGASAIYEVRKGEG